jgi:hypothetical protein
MEKYVSAAEYTYLKYLIHKYCGISNVDLRAGIY